MDRWKNQPARRKIMKKKHPVMAAGTRILIVRLSAIGDVMHATAVVHNLKRLQPGCHITWLVSPPAASLLAGNPDVQARRDTEITVKTSLGKVLDIIGEDNVKTFLEEKAAAASYNPDYDCSVDTVLDYWMHLSLFIWVFALLAMITLEFIDKDKR